MQLAMPPPNARKRAFPPHPNPDRGLIEKKRTKLYRGNKRLREEETPFLDLEI
jgi:hypothetical protein